MALLHAGHAVSSNAELVIAVVFLGLALTLLLWPKPAGEASETRVRRRRTTG